MELSELLEVLVRLGEKIVNQTIEIVGMFDEGRMARAGHNPQICVRDVVIDEDCVVKRDEVMVATDSEGWAWIECTKQK